jgi:hypothetical protein
MKTTISPVRTLCIFGNALLHLYASNGMIESPEWLSSAGSMTLPRRESALLPPRTPPSYASVRNDKPLFACIRIIEWLLYASQTNHFPHFHQHCQMQPSVWSNDAFFLRMTSSRNHVKLLLNHLVQFQTRLIDIHHFSNDWYLSSHQTVYLASCSNSKFCRSLMATNLQPARSA